MVSEEQLQTYMDNRQVLWLTFGNTKPTHLHAVTLTHDNQLGFIVWGYSVYRRKHRFRTLGISVRNFVENYPILELFDDQTKAINFWIDNNSNSGTFEELKAIHTPNLKFLKKENYRHNISVEI